MQFLQRLTQAPIRSFAAVASIALGLLACNATGDEAIAVDRNDLGITHVDIGHRTEGSDRLLMVRGLDDRDQEIAVATLRSGMVFYSADPDLIPAAWHPGNELTIVAGDESAPFVSPDREPHAVREPFQPALASFVRLSPVASAIRDEAGIRFTRVDRNGEVAFAPTTCTASRFPNTVGDPKQCCQDGNSTWHKIGNGSTSVDKLGYRTYSTACRTSGGATGCTTDCYYGPCGSHNETVTASLNTTNAKVFYPTSNTGVCGYDSNGATAGGVYAPEQYGSQTVYAGVAASCPYSSCGSDGTPGYTLTVNVVVNTSSASGYVWSASGVNCSAAGENVVCTYAFAPNTSMTISDQIPNQFVGWSGACTGSGTCSITMTGNKTVTASYYCPPGEACMI